MDGYFQSAIVVNSIQQSNIRTNNAAQTPRVPPFPPTNKEFNCNELNTPDGIYPLLHETFYDTIAPQFASGTRASVVTHIHAGSINTTIIESSEEDSNSDTLVKSAALPIPNTSSRRRTMRNGSASSITNGLHSLTSSGGLQQQPQKLSSSSTNGNSYFPHNSELNSNADLSSSYNTNNSLSSLFGKSITTHPTSLNRSASQISTSISKSMNNSKPKNHLSKTNSNFVLRFISHDNLQKLMSSNNSLLYNDDFTFFNIGSSFIWVDSNSKPKEPLSRIVFSKAFPTCHDINKLTQCEDHIDIIIGFSTGDIIWYEPLSCKYVRLNKGGCMVSSPVTMIKWLPSSEDLFIVLFKNGSAMIMDKERDDQTFHIPDPSAWIVPDFLALRPHRSSKHNPVSFWKISDKGLTDVSFSPDNQHMAVTGMDGSLRILNYRNDCLTDVFPSYFGKLNCVDWSPDGLYILTGGEDDLVTLWSFLEKRMIARCQGHKSWVTGVAFDPFNCPDGRNYRFGSVGEDCNLILWDFSLSALKKPKHPPRVAATSPPKSPTVKRNSTIQLSSPPPPLAPLPSTNVERKKSFKNRGLFRGFSTPDASTLSSPTTNNPPGSFSRFRKMSLKSGSIFSSSLEMTDVIIEDPIKQQLPVFHPPLKRSQAAVLLPTTTNAIHADPCVSIMFREKTLVTTDRRGRIRTWGRPPKEFML